MRFCQNLEKVFNEHENFENAASMSKYMKGNFEFFGIKTEHRRQLFKSVSQECAAELDRFPRETALLLYSKKQREFHYCAIEILIKNLKNKYIPEDSMLIEQLIITHSWWDSVDVIAKYLLGGYLQQFPLETMPLIEQFSNSNNMWLNRSAILFQLGYKDKTNFDLLTAICLQHKNAKEFFIQKAIGWALREYGKTNSQAVKDFVTIAELKKLSENEALKNIK